MASRSKKKRSPTNAPSNQEIVNVVKFGGSAMDTFVGENSDPSIVQSALEQIISLHRQGHRFILTVGAGPGGDTAKDLYDSLQQIGSAKSKKASTGAYLKSLPHMTEYTSRAVFEVLNRLNTGGGRSRREIQYHKDPQSNNGDMPFSDMLSNGYLEKNLPVVESAPEYSIRFVLPGDEEMPISESDSHFLVIAEYLGANYKYHQDESDDEKGIPLNVILIKNTDGVWAFDPNKTKEDGVDQRRNIFYPDLTVEYFLSGKIDTMGTDNRPNHLLEHNAAQLFQTLKEAICIKIVDVKRPDVLARIVRGKIDNHDQSHSRIYNPQHPLYNAVRAAEKVEGTTTSEFTYGIPQNQRGKGDYIIPGTNIEN